MADELEKIQIAKARANVVKGSLPPRRTSETIGVLLELCCVRGGRGVVTPGRLKGATSPYPPRKSRGKSRGIPSSFSRRARQRFSRGCHLWGKVGGDSFAPTQPQRSSEWKPTTSLTRLVMSWNRP